MNTTGQTAYEQLQEFLNECIKLGYFSNLIHKCFVSCDTDGVHFISWDESIHKSIHMSYHELFSKDSGIMEFVEWNSIGNRAIDYHPDIDYYEPEYAHIKYDRYYDSNVQYHYMMMGPVTAYMKIQYFLSNAKLPTKSE